MVRARSTVLGNGRRRPTFGGVGTSALEDTGSMLGRDAVATVAPSPAPCSTGDSAVPTMG
jgi:hypothetical protein